MHEIEFLQAFCRNPVSTVVVTRHFLSFYDCVYKYSNRGCLLTRDVLYYITVYIVKALLIYRVITCSDNACDIIIIMQLSFCAVCMYGAFLR